MKGSPLLRIVRDRIAETGPLSVAEFMALALGHPVHGYYRCRSAIGAGGDFVTAPEISQMFGELIGAWVLDLWQRSGAKVPLTLVECGPGRGTLMADIVRTTGLIPAARDGVRVHLVETNNALKREQESTLRSVGVTAIWHETLDSLPDTPAFIVANEFLDALPIRQFVRRGDKWHEVMVASAGESLAFVPSPLPTDPSLIPETFDDAAEGAVFEMSPARESAAAFLAGHVAENGGAAILIDYGHAETAIGDTLQAVSGHEYCDPLENPGEVDLTSHVDFAATARAGRDAGAAVFGPVPQGAFLDRLGLRQRAEVLKASGNAGNIDAAVARLAAPDAMGTLFKVMAFVQKGGPAPAGFD